MSDRTWVRLPFRGWYSKLDGSNMEDHGCPPDIVVANHPDVLARGGDTQLDRAIEELMNELGDRQ